MNTAHKRAAAGNPAVFQKRIPSIIVGTLDELSARAYVVAGNVVLVAPRASRRATRAAAVRAWRMAAAVIAGRSTRT